MDLQSANGLLDAPGVVTMKGLDEVGRERTRLNFAHAVRERFAFLDDMGFSEVESLPTLVRYRSDQLEVTLYHGRQSFELGFEISRDGARYAISELIGVADAEAAKRYRNFAATTSAGIIEGLNQLAELVTRYGDRALRGDSAFFAMLEDHRKSWSEGYALDVLEKQLRPKAQAAFQQGNYREAAELYERIRPRLSAAEEKKTGACQEACWVVTPAL
jgi:hypothetical protein